MIDKEETKEYGALRKHREKRRAKTAGQQGRHQDDGEGSNTEKNSQTASTEPSLGDFLEFSPGVSDKQEMVSTIIATTADREKMRKISILGLEDPADGVRHSRRDKPRESGVIVATEAAREQMRKISRLGLEDPVDAMKELNQNKKNRRKDRESRSLHIGRTKQNLSQDPHHVQDNAKKPKTPCERAEIPLDVLYESNKKSPRPRSRSVDNDCEISMFERDHVPSKKDRKKTPRTRSFDLDKSFVPEGRIEFPAIDVRVPQHEITKNVCGPKAFGGVIEATKEQQQLMRKVSALGMYDPVFGNIHKDMEISHASIVFEDMDLNDVPKDMRDLLGHTSEHTDPVIRAYMESTESDSYTSSEKVEGNGFVPPRGSFVRRGSKLEGPVATAPSPARPKMTKSQRALPTRHGKSDRTREYRDTFPRHVSNSYSFIPPTGSFNVRKPKKSSSAPNRDVLLKDIELAARAQSMFAEDSLLGMSATYLETNLHASLGSIDLDMSCTSLDDSINSDNCPKKGSIPKMLRRNRSRSPSERNLYVPPSLIPKPSNMGVNHRGKSVSGESLSQHEEIILSPSSVKGKKAGKNLLSPRKRLAKQESTRSWNGDNDVEDPMANSTMMWASLSALNTDFATSEDT